MESARATCIPKGVRVNRSHGVYTRTHTRVGGQCPAILFLKIAFFKGHFTVSQAAQVTRSPTIFVWSFT